MKKIVSLLLVFVIACSLCACSGSADRMAELCGVWEMIYVEEAESAKDLLESMDFYEEEIALADLTNLEVVMTVEFTQEKTYCYTYDIPATKAYIRSFYDNTVVAVYNAREQLTDIYGFETINMTEDEFKLFYADLFSLTSYEELLDYFVDNCLDYESLVDFDKGTFRLNGSKILCTAEGSNLEEEMSYSISGNTLTLVYADGKEVYTKR